MNNRNITTSAILPKLKGVLNEDISTLKVLLSKNTFESDMYDLVDSIIFAKEKLLDQIPKVDGMDQIPTTNQLLGIKSYSSIDTSDTENQNGMLSKFLELETDQLSAIKNCVGEGIPDELQEVMNKVSSMYIEIVDQLERTNKTHQIGTIVL